MHFEVLDEFKYHIHLFIFFVTSEKHGTCSASVTGDEYNYFVTVLNLYFKYNVTVRCHFQEDCSILYIQLVSIKMLISLPSLTIPSNQDIDL